MSESKKVISAPDMLPPTSKMSSLDQMSSQRRHGSNQTVKQIIQNSKLDKLDTQLLLRHILGLSRSMLVIRDNYQLNTKEYQSYVKLCNECLSGKPIAYILGYKEFYSHNFKVNAATLIPRPETELLVDTVLNLAKTGDRVLDLATGSGCIGISLKLENPMLEVTATDKYGETLSVAIENASLLAANVKFIQSDWYNAINEIYDIIVCNPPYIAVDDSHLENLAFEPRFALTDFSDGMSAIKQIVADSREHLDGYLILEHGYNQGVDTFDFMVRCGYSDVRTIKDYANLDRVTLGRMEK